VRPASPSLEKLLQRATSGKKLEKHRVFRPSWLYNMLEDPFWVWCEYHAPASERVDETTPFDQYRMDQGNLWEARYVAREFPRAYAVKSRWGLPALRETLEAMLRGEAAIHGGALWLLGEDVYGKSDLLVRSDAHASELGDYHFRVKEIKNSGALKTYHALQAAFYSWMLGELQGYRPETFDVVLQPGAGEQSIAFASVADAMREQLVAWRALRDGRLALEPLAYDSTPSPWRIHANRRLVERGDVSLLPGVGAATASAWRERGFATLEQITALGPERCAQELRADHHYYHALAWREARPVFRPGEAAAIQRRERLVYVDVEDTSLLDGELVTRPHVYMIGAATPDGATRIWTARGEADEARIWSDFLDWLGDPSDVALYCWSRYEVGRFQSAAAAHPALAARLLAAADALIDLKDEIKHRPYFPVASYSIKQVAPACGFHWSQRDVDGRSAQLLYLEWLRSGDDAIIEKVEQYNREDVLAMLAVDRCVSSPQAAIAHPVE
jgi:uncharacterized protein